VVVVVVVVVFFQLIQVNVKVESAVRPRPLPSTDDSILFALIIL